MIQPLIRKAVSERFQDESISVREAVVSLVGSLVSSPSHSNIAEQFHNCLLYALSDKGVSVRKRAIKIFHDILKRGDSPKRAQVLSKLLRIASNPKEEDTGVRELIYDTFYDLWFRFSPDNNDSVDAAGVNERKKRRKIGHDGKRVSISEEDIITSSLAASGTTEEGTRRKVSLCYLYPSISVNCLYLWLLLGLFHFTNPRHHIFSKPFYKRYITQAMTL